MVLRDGRVQDVVDNDGAYRHVRRRERRFQGPDRAETHGFTVVREVRAFIAWTSIEPVPRRGRDHPSCGRFWEVSSW